MNFIAEGQQIVFIPYLNQSLWSFGLSPNQAN